MDLSGLKLQLRSLRLESSKLETSAQTFCIQLIAQLLLSLLFYFFPVGAASGRPQIYDFMWKISYFWCRPEAGFMGGSGGGGAPSGKKYILFLDPSREAEAAICPPSPFCRPTPAIYSPPCLDYGLAERSALTGLAPCGYISTASEE